MQVATQSRFTEIDEIGSYLEENLHSSRFSIRVQDQFFYDLLFDEVVVGIIDLLNRKVIITYKSNEQKQACMQQYDFLVKELDVFKKTEERFQSFIQEKQKGYFSSRSYKQMIETIETGLNQLAERTMEYYEKIEDTQLRYTWLVQFEEQLNVLTCFFELDFTLYN